MALVAASSCLRARPSPALLSLLRHGAIVRRVVAVQCSAPRRRAFAPSSPALHMVVEQVEEESLTGEEKAKAEHITKVGVFCNLLLSVGKATVGAATNSTALIADALHSLSDLVSDVVTIGTLRYARKTPDHSHPYGYGRYEAIGGMGVGMLLVGGAVSVGNHAVGALVPLVYQGAMTGIQMGSAAVACALASLAVKEWLFHKTLKAGKEARSSVVVANAHHHRADALSSVVALVGISGSMMGMPILDPLGGILVAGMILKTGVEIVWRAIRELTDSQQSPDRDLLSRVESVCRRVAEGRRIQRVTNLRCRRMGHYCHVDLQLLVSPQMSVSAAQRAADLIRHCVVQEIPEVSDVFVKVEANDLDTPWGLVVDQGCDSSGCMGGPTAYSAWTHATLVSEIARVVKQHELPCWVVSVNTHYLAGRLQVEIGIGVDDKLALSVRDIRGVAESVRDVVTAEVEGLSVADVFLCLGVWGSHPMQGTDAA